MPIYTNFETDERAPEKTRFFFVKIFQKVPKNGAFTICFFKNLPEALKIWQKQRLFGALGELGARKIIFFDLKKGQKIFKFFFENPPPPRENPKSTPVYVIIDFLF